MLCLFMLVFQAVYEFVVRHFLACVSQPAIGFGTTASIDIAGEQFSATGLMITAVSFVVLFIQGLSEKLLGCIQIREMG